MEIVKSILKNNPCYKAGKTIVVKGLMLHSVGCRQPSAKVFVKGWDSPNQDKACVHAFIDADNGTVYQTLPWEHRGWHCGGSANNTHIGVEMCEPGCLCYEKGVLVGCSDREAALAAVKRTYDTAVELFAMLCEKYGLDPTESGVIISHKEGHERGVASGHVDPDHLWKALSCGYTMDGFRADVKAAVDKAKGKQESVPGEMQVSDRGVKLVAGFEGYRQKAYRCPAGVWTIGYGHTAGVKEGDTLPSQEAAMALLREDLKKYADYVNVCVKKGILTFVPNQNQFDALTSFCYNCGNGNLQKLVQGRDAATVAEKLLLYNKGGGKVLEGLKRRREEERDLFLS